LIQRLRARPFLAIALFLAALTLLFLSGVLFPRGQQVMAGSDMVGYYYPYYEAVRTAVRAGHLPVWEPDLFGGYPFMAQPQQNAFYPPAWINFIVPTTIGVSWYVAFHIWIMGLGMVALVRALGGRWLPALLAGIGFAYGGLLTGRLWAGHSTVYAVFAWTPWIIVALIWSIHRERAAAAVVAGLPFGLAILAGHIPSLLYVGLFWGAFVLYLLLTLPGRRWLVVRQAAIMFGVALGLAAVALAPFIQFSLSSGRVATADYAFATDYSLPPAHLATLLVPEFFGEPLRIGYWSVPTFEELTYYAGLLAVLGIALALRRPTRLGVFYIILIIAGLWLALGRYGVLYELAYRFLPPFRLVRAPGRAAFIFLFAASALLGHTLSEWRSLPADERQTRLGRFWPSFLAVVAVAGVAALAATGAVFMAVHPTDTSGRLWHQIGGYAVALAVSLIGGGLLWLYLTAESRRPAEAGWLTPRRALLLSSVGLIVLVTADTWLFSYKMVRLAPAVPDPAWTDARAILGDAPDGRVLPWGLPLFSQAGAMQVGLPSVFGYDSLEPAAHIALASSVPDPRSSAYDVLGAAYVLALGPLDDFTEGERGLTLLANQGSAWVYRRARPLPIARLVYAAEVIADPAAAVDRVHAPDFDPATTAILNADAPCPVGPAPDAPGTAEIVSHEPTRWEIQVAGDAPGLLLLAENAYPGWEVTVDGAAAESLTAYTSIRAVCVPAGEHVVEWTYRPTVIWAGGLLTLAFVALLVVALLMLRRLPRGI
jgi:hypothetical protein